MTAEAETDGGAWASYLQMAASLAHEVRNPLALMRAEIQLIELNDDRREFERNFGVIKREIDRINSLLGEFILFARPAEKKERISARTLISEALDETAALGVSFRADVPDCGVLGDKDALLRVFVNIIKNAAEASSGICELEIEGVKGEGFLELRFRDHGEGISAEALAKTARPFFTTKADGSGLGLSIIRNTLERQGGSFRLEPLKDGCAAVARLLICDRLPPR